MIFDRLKLQILKIIHNYFNCNNLYGFAIFISTTKLEFRHRQKCRYKVCVNPKTGT